MQVCGTEIEIKGRLLRVGSPDGDGYHFLEDPASVVKALRESRVRVDLLTFMQRLPDVTPKFSYPMEWDNFAALPVTTFEQWWTQQLGFKGRNKAKQADKQTRA